MDNTSAIQFTINTQKLMLIKIIPIIQRITSIVAAPLFELNWRTGQYSWTIVDALSQESFNPLTP